MDNFRFDITSVDDIRQALVIAFGSYKAVQYEIINAEMRDVYYNSTYSGTKLVKDDVKGKPTLILYWAAISKPGVHNLLVSSGPEEIQGMIEGWLKSCDYGKEPDHDGHNRKGWRIFNESWGHVMDQWQAFCAIQPKWAIFGK